MKRTMLAIAMLLIGSGAAEALDFTPTATEILVTYVEPNKNVDGTPLFDLDHTNVYFQLGAGLPVKGPDIKASTTNGGVPISTKLTVPIGPNTEATVTVWATATDMSGNEGKGSTPVTKRIDRLAPEAPL